MKKNIAMILAGVMLMGCMTGCSENESVSAEDLIENAFDTEYVSYDLSTSANLFVEAADGYVDIELYSEYYYECSPMVCYLEGNLNMDLDVEGYDEPVLIEEDGMAYLVLEDGIETRYYYDNDSENWLVGDERTSRDSYIPELSEDMFDNLEVEETNSGYEVTGELIKYKDLFGCEDNVIEYLVAGTEDCEYEVVLSFTEDKKLESFKINIMADDELCYLESIGDAQIEDFEMLLEVKSTKGNEVEVPSKIMQNAMSPDEIVIDENETETEEIENEEVEISLGTITDTSYENYSLNIGWTIPSESWLLLSREELDEAYNDTLDVLDEDYQEVIENASIFYDMMAGDIYTGENINVVVENLGQYPKIYSEEEYATLSDSTLLSLYEDLGYTDINITESTIEIMGETHPCIEVSYVNDSGMQYQVQGYIGANERMIVITSTSNESIEACRSYFEMFYRLAM